MCYLCYLCYLCHLCYLCYASTLGDLIATYYMCYLCYISTLGTLLATLLQLLFFLCYVHFFAALLLTLHYLPLLCCTYVLQFLSSANQHLTCTAHRLCFRYTGGTTVRAFLYSEKINILCRYLLSLEEDMYAVDRGKECKC